MSSLEGCPNCLENICSCGYEYRNWTTQRVREQIAMLQKVLDKQEPIETLYSKRDTCLLGTILMRADVRKMYPKADNFECTDSCGTKWYIIYPCKDKPPKVLGSGTTANGAWANAYKNLLV